MSTSEHATFRAYLTRLYPVLRSLTGDGVRATHRALSEIHQLDTNEIPSGMKVLDWEVPLEWSVKEAYLADSRGRRIVDVANHPLHILNYSEPFRGQVDRQTLEDHLFSDPAQPDAIPYVTSYYQRRWGFCLPHAQRMSLPDGTYDVVIDTSLKPGSMTWSQAVIAGDTAQEVLISTYTCHPGLANDELCAPIAMAMLARRISSWKRRRLTYRFLFIPETIGSIAFLSLHGDRLRETLVAGYNVSNIGLPRPFTYKRSRAGSTLADRAAAYVLGRRDDARMMEFYPAGSDERQYCSPGFNLPVGSIRRTGDERLFPTYHCSLDRPEDVSDDAVIQTIDVVEQICRVVDENAHFRNLKPFGEPHLGRYGLYPTIGDGKSRAMAVESIMWVLSYSDGDHDLLSIAERSGIPFEKIAAAADQCRNAGLLEKLPNPVRGL